MSCQPMDPHELTTEAADTDQLHILGDSADRAQLLGMIAKHKARPVIRQHLDYIREHRLRHWRWSVEDETSGEVFAFGWALTAGAAGRRKHRAYLRVLRSVKR